MLANRSPKALKTRTPPKPRMSADVKTLHVKPEALGSKNQKPEALNATLHCVACDWLVGAFRPGFGIRVSGLWRAQGKTVREKRFRVLKLSNASS